MTNPTSMAGAIRQSFVSQDRRISSSPLQTQPMTEQERHIRQACNELADTLIMKNRDYGKGNIAEFGQLGVLVRLSDKYNRLKNLIPKDGVPQFEPIDDSWKDMAGYAIIGWLYSKGQW